MEQGGSLPPVTSDPTETVTRGTRTQRTVLRPRTETTGAAVGRSLVKNGLPSEGSTPTPPTSRFTPFLMGKPVETRDPTEEPDSESESADSQGLGSGGTPTGSRVRDEMAQYGQQVETASPRVKTPEDGQRLKPTRSVLTAARQTLTTVQSETRTTLEPGPGPGPGTSTGEKQRDDIIIMLSLNVLLVQFPSCFLRSQTTAVEDLVLLYRTVE